MHNKPILSNTERFKICSNQKGNERNRKTFQKGLESVRQNITHPTHCFSYCNSGKWDALQNQCISEQ